MGVNELERAVAFVERHGTTAEQARLRHLLHEDVPPADVIEQFRRSQRNDGGWAPMWADDYSSVDATCFQVAQAGQLGLSHDVIFVTDAIRFLAQRQELDGSWEEDIEEAEHAPFWAMPGDAGAQLYLTANAGYWLGQSGMLQGSARDAADFLAAAQGADGQLPSFLQSHWLAAGLWHRLGYTAESQRTLDYLAGQIGQLPSGDMAWMLVALMEAEVPASHPTVAAGLDNLMRMQNADGYWTAGPGMDNAVHVTIEALRALQLGKRMDGDL